MKKSILSKNWLRHHKSILNLRSFLNLNKNSDNIMVLSYYGHSKEDLSLLNGLLKKNGFLSFSLNNKYKKILFKSNKKNILKNILSNNVLFVIRKNGSEISLKDLKLIYNNISKSLLLFRLHNKNYRNFQIEPIIGKDMETVQIKFLSTLKMKKFGLYSIINRLKVTL